MSGNKKTVAIVIASYKYGHLAAHCIESVLSQTRKPDKILFVDDGVGDCKHLIKLYPQIDFVLRRKNLGTVDNFQDMLERVQTDMCLFLGADNWLRSDAIEKLMKFDADIVTYDIVVTGELKDDLHSNFSMDLSEFQGDFYWKRNSLHHGSMLYNVSLAKKVGYKRLNKHNIYTAEDLNLWNGMLKYDAKVVYCEEGLLYYRRHKENFNQYGKYYFVKQNSERPLIKFLRRIYSNVSSFLSH